ncbi:photosystem II reaction center PSB28 protein, chloroplastic-like isoform X2 [Triticum dicoccoides]|uniref:photosystem II reaction center PSB28 protein, chloroplastic-like isoform X2 n=1 Tax=Triticum dicoccoides TaxID=85692 RepID=UPI00188E5A96|nr:photosystem II reaction center PSB28 protein, chloroplastic-like isoform X2 [Triticum dicoccoides]
MAVVGTRGHPIAPAIISLLCTTQNHTPFHPPSAPASLSSSPSRPWKLWPSIQFIQGTDEQTIPDVRLTKSRDGSNGVAIFTFDQPSVFDSSAELGDITGFYMIDEEGTLSSVDVSAKFVNGKPAAVEAKYVMRTPRDWDRFMRFMERYSQANGLQFLKK